MKTLSSPSFFRTFDLLVGTSNPGLKADQWTVDDVRFTREKHSFSGGTHCFVMEIFFLTRPGRHGWEFMVAKEHWWSDGHKRIIKTLRWSQRTGGEAKNLMTWLRAQEAALQRLRRTDVDHP
jgi:hypothetical protein